MVCLGSIDSEGDLMNGLFWHVVAAVTASQAANPAAELHLLTARITVPAHRYVDKGASDGISIAMVRCGRTAFVTAGQADRAAHRPVTPEVPFEIGSVSKTFTALLLAQAITEGRARIEDDVRRYLPGRYDNLQWSDGKPITLGELADTTSGLPDFLPDPEPITKLPADQQTEAASKLLASYSNAAFLDDLRGVKLVSRSGSTSRHSNVAAQLLGYIVGRLFSRPFDAALAQKIEVPNGMGSGSATRLGKTAVGYDGDGKEAPPFGGESIQPAGGLRYSAKDMARFLDLELKSLNPAVKLSQQVRFVEPPDRQLAFTWVRSQPRPGIYKFRMSGGTFGSSSYVEFYPSLGYGVALMANRAAASTQDDLQGIAESLFSDVGPSLTPCRASRAHL
jgi:serine-type D-Ala-D-Ala carboxypeptidase/endopeptidase